MNANYEHYESLWAHPIFITLIAENRPTHITETLTTNERKVFQKLTNRRPGFEEITRYRLQMKALHQSLVQLLVFQVLKFSTPVNFNDTKRYLNKSVY